MWIIVGIAILALIAIFSWFSTQFNIFADVFNANIYTLLALISAAIGGLYFWASSKSYKDYKIKDKVMKLFEDETPSKNLPVKREIDLSTVDLQSLVGDMKQMLTSPTPIFFKGWGNKRLELDVKRVGLMNDYIQNIIATGQSFIKLKADSIISFEKIQLLAKQELYQLKTQADGAEYDFKLLTEKYQYELTKYQTEKDKMILSVEREKAEIRYLNAQAKQAEAQAAQEEERVEGMKVSTEEAKVRVAMFKVATGELKFSELPKTYQTYILTIFLNADANKLSDFDIREQMKDALVQQAKAEADKKVSDAGSARADTELKFMKNEQIRKDAKL